MEEIGDEEMNCPICNEKMKKTKEPYFFGDIKLGEFEAEKCTKCKEVFFTEHASDKIDAKAKELGLWGIGKEGTLGYSGNSIIVRVPKKIAQFLKFKEGKKVFIHPEGKKKLVVEA
ncbi:MAG: AbrB/MazE/SpoVT family DNA-binding domain-containing protein [archaeon]